MATHPFDFDRYIVPNYGLRLVKNTLYGNLANGVYVSDCNNATSGHIFYYADGNTLNKPSGVSSWLLIKVVGKSGNFFTQIASEENVTNGRIWYRTKSANSFGDWTEINIADINKLIKRYSSLKSYSITAFGNYNIAIATVFVSGIGTAVVSIQSHGNGDATITHISGDQSATNTLSASVTGGQLTITTTAEVFTFTFVNATMII